MTKIWINGKFANQDRAKISVCDRGFMYGDGVFETMRSYAGNIFRLDQHLDRLFGAMKEIKIKDKYSKKYLREAIYKSIKANRLSNAYIKLIVTRGEGRFGISHKDIFTPNVVITSKYFEGYPEWMFKSGLSAGMMGIQNERSITSGIKTLNYLPFILARLHAKEKGFDEAILTNTKDFITEAATSNIFIVKRDNIITPSPESGILPGITRGVIIEIAKKLKLGVKERRVSRRELLAADEIFLTNSLAEVLPVTRVDSKPVCSGRVGPITKLLRISYQKQVIREAWM